MYVTKKSKCTNCYIGAKCVVPDTTHFAPMYRLVHFDLCIRMNTIYRRMNATRGDANLHPGVTLLSDANCAHEHGLSQLIIQPIVCCTCPHFVWCINLITRILKRKKHTHKQFGQSLYKLLLKGTYCFGARRLIHIYSVCSGIIT